MIRVEKKTVESTKGLSGMLRAYKSTMKALGLEPPKKKVVKKKAMKKATKGRGCRC